MKNHSLCLVFFELDYGVYGASYFLPPAVKCNISPFLQSENQIFFKIYGKIRMKIVSNP